MITLDEIEASKTAKGGWTRETLESLGVSWPPEKGWKERLVEEARIIQAACDLYGVSLHDFNAKNAKRGQRATMLPVKARRLACKAFYAKGYTKAKIARLVGLSGASPVRYLITGKR